MTGTNQHILSLSYGKDSIACLEAIRQLGWPLERIVHVEIWATETIPADLPPMVQFKTKADAIIRERYGLEVEHISAPYTYEQVFHHVKTRSRTGKNGQIYGWPFVHSPWCTGMLKKNIVKKIQKGGQCCLGIAADELQRIERLEKEDYLLPLAEAGWTEADCRRWCEENDLLSPIYTKTTRGGCWFCHNQRTSQLRLLRRDYPEYWALMLQWDDDSPVAFKSGCHSVHDYDRRFQLEDEGLLDPDDRTFRWDMLDEPLNYRLL